MSEWDSFKVDGSTISAWEKWGNTPSERKIIGNNLYVLLYNNGIFINFEIYIMPHNMEVTTYSNFRQHLKSFLDKVFLNQGPLYISRNNGEDVVVLAKADYESIMETFHLLKSPKNASRLMEGIEEYKKGKGQERPLIEE